MTILDILITSIKSRRPVSFEYNKQGKITGLRQGNPYAVFIFTSKVGSISTKVHILQTDGVSDSLHLNPLPCFRMFNIEDLSNVRHLDKNPLFEPFHEMYNPEWEGYKDVIEKI